MTRSQVWLLLICSITLALNESYRTTQAQDGKRPQEERSTEAEFELHPLGDAAKEQA